MVNLYWPRHSGFGLVDQLLDAIDQDFGRWTGSRHEFPPVDVTTSEEGAIVTCELPGMDEKALELSLEGDVLTLRGKRQVEIPEGATVLMRERRDVDFARSIRLPFAVEPKQGDARYVNGVLTVHVHRKEADKPRRIAITNT